MRSILFTSESVTEGHPDKIADQISDAVLDAVLKDDPMGRVGCETLVTTGLVVVAGEITIKKEFRGHLEYENIARQVIRDVGYTRAKYGFDADTCGVISCVKPQSPDIAMGVDTGGAGDQGMMFGYACDETPELMPMPIQLAHQLTHKLSEVRKKKVVDFLRPDGKSQVTIEYIGGRPARVDAVVISTQHSEKVSHSDSRSRHRGSHQARHPGEDVRQEHQDSTSTRPAASLPAVPWATRPHRAQDHRRHLRRLRPPRRRRTFREGSHQGGPFRLLHGALRREEYRRRGPRHARWKCSSPTRSALPSRSP